MSNDGGDNIDTDGIREEPLFLTGGHSLVRRDATIDSGALTCIAAEKR